MRHWPYHNFGDAESHARYASDPAWFKERGCRLAPEPDDLELSQSPCKGGRHVTRPVLMTHGSRERNEA